MWPEVFNLPLYTVHVSSRGRWLLRAPSEDPFLPATVIVAAVEVLDFCGRAKWGAVVTRLFDPRSGRTRAEVGNIDWRDDLLQLSRLIDTLSPERDDPEAFCIKKNAVSRELWRLARWAR
jgi:hypothetical protein